MCTIATKKFGGERGLVCSIVEKSSSPSFRRTYMRSIVVKSGIRLTARNRGQFRVFEALPREFLCLRGASLASFALGAQRAWCRASGASPGCARSSSSSLLTAWLRSWRRESLAAGTDLSHH
jgi:hypothetical protein